MADVKSLDLVEVTPKDNDLMEQTIQLLQSQWPEKDASVRAKHIARQGDEADGSVSRTLVLAHTSADGDRKRRVVAHARLDTYCRLFRGSRAYIVHSVCVDPSLRRRGYGVEMMKQTESVASRDGLGYLILRCAPQLKAFYERCGYALCDAPLLEQRATMPDRGALLMSIRAGTTLRKADGRSRSNSPAKRASSCWLCKCIEQSRASAGDVSPSARTFPGLKVAVLRAEAVPAPRVLGHVVRVGPYFFRTEALRVSVRKADKFNMMRAFKARPGDQADWPNGLHSLTCPVTLRRALSQSDPKFSNGVLALEQIVTQARTAAGKKKRLALRVMPVVFHLDAYAAIRESTRGAAVLLPALDAKAARGPNLSDVWGSCDEFRQFVTNDYVDNYQKRKARGRAALKRVDMAGNIIEVKFADKKQASGAAESSRGGGTEASALSKGSDAGGAAGGGGDKEGPPMSAKKVKKRRKKKKKKKTR